jgi:Protein of unknown function (DUF3048) N-terminal domain/Protein of unknown function (DUF3048) C-terminal domain
MADISFNITPKPVKKNKIQKKHLYISTILALVLVLTGATFAYFQYTKRDNSDSGNSVESNKSGAQSNDLPTQNTEPPKPVYVQSPINGIMLEETEYNAIKTKPVLAVMIQNNAASRPEFGLNQADVVYETLAEGGITRFMGMYWSQGSEKVMSLRSARKYYVDLLGDYNSPAYMHIGYSDGADNVSAIKAMRTYGIRDLENIGGTFERDRNCERTKNTEHCAFSSTTKLWELAAKTNWTSDMSKFQTWKFKDPMAATTSVGTDVTDFTTNFSGLYAADYSVIWKYNKDTNRYLRYNLNKTPYLDGYGKQVETDVVVYQKINSYLSGDSKGHMVQEVIGSGTAYIMQDGKSYKVNWKKPNFATRTVFTDATSGEDFVFNRGRQWIMLVSKANEIVDNTPRPSVSPAAVNGQ